MKKITENHQTTMKRRASQIGPQETETKEKASFGLTTEQYWCFMRLGPDEQRLHLVKAKRTLILGL